MVRHETESFNGFEFIFANRKQPMRYTQLMFQHTK